jgi:hypothetical protein
VPLNQLEKLQVSLVAESPPSPSDGTIARRGDPQPARLRSSHRDSAKMNIDIPPTATRKPTNAPFIGLS